MLEAFFAFVNCIINKQKTNGYNTKGLEKLVLVFFFKQAVSNRAAQLIEIKSQKQ